MVSLAGMATHADGNMTTVAENEVFDIINFVAIYYEKSGIPFFEKNTSSRDFLKVSKDTESFEINSVLSESTFIILFYILPVV